MANCLWIYLLYGRNDWHPPQDWQKWVSKHLRVPNKEKLFYLKKWLIMSFDWKLRYCMKCAMRQLGSLIVPGNLHMDHRFGNGQVGYLDERRLTFIASCSSVILSFSPCNVPTLSYSLSFANPLTTAFPLSTVWKWWIPTHRPYKTTLPHLLILLSNRLDYTFWPPPAAICSANIPGIVVTTCHNYQIHKPFQFKCMECKAAYGRHR